MTTGAQCPKSPQNVNLNALKPQKSKMPLKAAIACASVVPHYSVY